MTENLLAEIMDHKQLSNTSLFTWHTFR